MTEIQDSLESHPFMDPLNAQDRSMKTANEGFDVAIVGGGIIGLSLAWELAKEGLRICVLDKNSLGNEASWAASGMIPPGPRPEKWQNCPAKARLAGLSGQIQATWYSQLHEETAIDSEFRTTGALYLPDNALKARRQDWQRWGIDCEELKSEEIRQMEPELRAESAVYLPGESQVRPPRLLKALQAGCRQRGVTLRPHWEIDRIEQAGGRISSIAGSQGRISAGHYSLTAGCWSEKLAKMCGITVPMRAVRGQIALLQAPPGTLQHVVNLGLSYLTPRTDGRVLVGSTQEEVGFDKSCTVAGIESLLAMAQRLAPALGKCQLEKTWAGLRPAAGDDFPVLGRIPAVENASIATGHFRSGIQLAPATARYLAAMILGKELPVNLSSLGAERFTQ